MVVSLSILILRALRVSLAEPNKATICLVPLLVTARIEVKDSKRARALEIILILASSEVPGISDIAANILYLCLPYSTCQSTGLYWTVGMVSLPFPLFWVDLEEEMAESVSESVSLNPE